MNLEERWAKVWAWVQGQRAEVRPSILIPEAQVRNSGPMEAAIEPGDRYFAVFVNELFVTHARKWGVLIEPMVVAVCEFTYDGEKKMVPFVVGPSLLSGKVQQVPNGMLYSDTQVAGVCPYVGGNLVITIILCEASTQSFPKKFLDIIEKTAGSFSFGSALNAHLKVADAIVDGVEALFDLNGARPVIGHRWEYNHGFAPWLKPGFFALAATPGGALDPAALEVDAGRLCKTTDGRAEAYRDSDYVLYSLRAVPKREDVTELPFYRNFLDALKAAADRDEGAWQRAKAGLLAAYQQMITSPDLTWSQAQELAQVFQDKLVAAKKRADEFGTLANEPDAAHRNPAEHLRAIEVLPHGKERVGRLLHIHELMDLKTG
jgi:hypothetical protein